MHGFWNPNFKIFSERLLDPPINGGPPPPHGPDRTTAHLFISIAHRLLRVILPLLQRFGRTLFADYEIQSSAIMSYHRIDENKHIFNLP